MEAKLRAALEAGDSERLLLLCCDVDTNLTLTVGGYREGRVEQTLAHHIVCRTKCLQCLEMLIHRFGPSCLTCRNQYKQTPVHLAALTQKETWMPVILAAAGRDCFNQPGQFGRTAVHAAASNAQTGAVFDWLVRKCGRDCLAVQDDFGDTPVHQAAIKRDSQTMELIKSLVGSSIFYFQGRCQRTAFHCAAMNKLDNSSLKWLVSECGSGCLSLKDSQGSTPLHLAALYQTADSLQFLADQIDTQAFAAKNNTGWTVAHFAAQNSVSDSALAWCIRNLGPDCMVTSDSRGRTPAHLAAQHQGVDSLSRIKDSLGVRPFQLLDGEGNSVSVYARRNSKSGQLPSWMTPPQNQLPEWDPSLGANPNLPSTSYSDSASSIQSASSSGHTSKNRGDDTAVTYESVASGSVAVPTARPARRASEASRGTAAWEPSQQAISFAKRLSSESSSQPELDPSFTNWDFILDGGKKQLVGRGGFGKVYKALTDKLQTVAVKILKLSDSKDSGKLEKAIEREKRGIEFLKDVRHLNIVHFLKYERSDAGQFCIFTELIAGHSLLDLMNRQGRPFDESAVKKIAVQVCTALNFLHNMSRHIVHRDIKCSNIMLTHEGVVKLIDFGLAKEIVSTILEVSTDHLGGTWYYMAPELFSDDGRIAYSPKTDVWAFGCTVFEMLEMKPPNGEVVVHLVPVRIRDREMPDISARVSDNVKNFYRRCVERDAGRRADTAELLHHSFLTE